MLEATLKKPSSTHPYFAANVKSKKILVFRSVREVEDYHPISTPIVRGLSLAGHHLAHTKEAGQEQALRGRSEFSGRDHSISIHAPHLYFDIFAETPEIACAGARLPLSVRVEYDYARTNVQTVPTIHLHSVIISLESCTRVRTPAPYLGLGQEPQESWTERRILADSGQINIPLSERWNTGDLIKDLLIGEAVVPTFKTYNIARTYCLKIEIEAGAVQHPLMLKMERQLLVLPAICKEPAREPPLSSDARARLSLGEEPPPAYEQYEGESAVASGTTHYLQRLPSINTATRGAAYTPAYNGASSVANVGGFGFRAESMAGGAVGIGGSES